MQYLGRTEVEIGLAEVMVYLCVVASLTDFSVYEVCFFYIRQTVCPASV